jgi:hypothetical protein
MGSSNSTNQYQSVQEGRRPAENAGYAGATAPSAAKAKIVRAGGFSTSDNFKFAYDPSNGRIQQCFPGGLAEQSGLLNWVVCSIRLPNTLEEIMTESGPLLKCLEDSNNLALLEFAEQILGLEVVFDVQVDKHCMVLAKLRPLTVTFRDGSAPASAGSPGRQVDRSRGYQMADRREIESDKDRPRPVIHFQSREEKERRHLESTFGKAGGRAGVAASLQGEDERAMEAAMARSRHEQ